MGHAGRARKRHGQANCVIVRYADDFVVIVDGRREHVEQLREEITDVLSGIGLRLSTEKTSIVYLDQGFDFLGFRIQRRQKRGTQQRYVYVTSTRYRPGRRSNAPATRSKT
jgi:RNA-directed DNA polymerase